MTFRRRIRIILTEFLSGEHGNQEMTQIRYQRVILPLIDFVFKNVSNLNNLLHQKQLKLTKNIPLDLHETDDCEMCTFVASFTRLILESQPNWGLVNYR
jgi:hypothetical protein